MGSANPSSGNDKSTNPKVLLPTTPGHCLALDTLERFPAGIRRYVISAKDLYSRFGLTRATTVIPVSVTQFFCLVRQVFAYRIEQVLMGRGSEFMKDFKRALRNQRLRHWHTSPRTPKMNAHCERFNCTLQEEFVDYHEEELFYDLDVFNRKLIDYLPWFNGERPHWALKTQISRTIPHWQ